jgi:hypothetical protein
VAEIDKNCQENAAINLKSTQRQILKKVSNALLFGNKQVPHWVIYQG